MKVNGWKTCKVDDIFLLKGGSAFKEKYQGQLRGEYPFIKVSDFNLPNNKMFITSANNWISKEVKNALKPNIFPNNTIVFAKVGAALSSNRRRILTRNTAIDNNMMGAIPKDIDPLFGYYVFCTIDFNKFVQDGAVPSVNQKQIGNVFVYIPESTSEQQKIAEVLLTVDKRINLIDQKIAETEKLKTGLMQKLFSEGIGVQDSDGNWQPHSEFQDSPFGKVPSSWALETLEQRLDVIKDGTHFSPKSKEGPCKYLTSKNIRFGELDLTNISYISQEEHDRIYKGSPVKYGDILLTKDGANTGNAAINTLEEPFSLLSSVAYLRGSEKDVDHGYLLQLLLSPKGQSMMKSAMAGQAITRLTLKKIGAFVLPFAPIDEQNEIERILSTVDKKLQLLKKQKSETQQLKKGLMQKLLTGEWRVPVEETEAA
ncbi:restriction endonuclease subunit S [Vibrio fluvialis]